MTENSLLPNGAELELSKYFRIKINPDGSGIIKTRYMGYDSVTIPISIRDLVQLGLALEIGKSGTQYSFFSTEGKMIKITPGKEHSIYFADQVMIYDRNNLCGNITHYEVKEVQEFCLAVLHTVGFIDGITKIV